MAGLRAVWIGLAAIVSLSACNQNGFETEEEIPIPEGPPRVVKYHPHAHQQPYVMPRLPGLPGLQQVGKLESPPIGGVSLRTQHVPRLDKRIELRIFLIAALPSENELFTWKQVLDRLGTPYDVFIATTEPTLTRERLVGTDGVGRYHSVFLTTNNLSYDSGGGNFISALGNDEWATLFGYEREFGVRQVALYGAPTTFPEDYCVRLSGDQAVNNTEYPIKLTATGASIFNYLRSDQSIPLRFSFLYKGTIDPTCAASNPTQALLLDESGAVLAVRSITSDGRERMLFSFSSNPFFFHTPAFSYGVVRWATRGLFIGERRHFLNLDNDDWLNAHDHRLVDGSFAPGGFRLTAKDAIGTRTALRNFRQQWGDLLQRRFNINLAFNAENADPNAHYSCNTRVRSSDPLTSVTRCLADTFRWINHSHTHLNLDKTLWAPYDVVKTEVQENLRKGRELGLVAPTDIFKSPELSGLGFYDPDRTDPYAAIGKPQDFGLSASNPDFIRAAKDSGVKVLHSNLSVGSHKPQCFNCGIYHPLDPSLLTIPVRPNNVAYYVTTPEEEVSFFNHFYGPGGLFPTFTQNQTYQQILDFNSEVALFNLITGSVYSDYFHQGNLREYSAGRNLMFDWLDAVMQRYARHYTLPILSIPWSGDGLTIRRYVEVRTSHAALAPRVKAVWNRFDGRITVSAPADLGGSFYLTGPRSEEFVRYGGDRIAEIKLNPGQVYDLIRMPRRDDGVGDE